MQCQYLTYGDKSHKYTYTAGCKKTIIQQVTTETRQYFIRTAGTEVDDDDNDNNNNETQLSQIHTISPKQ
jgi:hypothetical protein